MSGDVNFDNVVKQYFLDHLRHSDFERTIWHQGLLR